MNHVIAFFSAFFVGYASLYVYHALRDRRRRRRYLDEMLRLAEEDYDKRHTIPGSELRWDEDYQPPDWMRKL